MVEGPQCHRVAHTHRKVLQGHRFKAISPNERFTEGAKAIDGKVLNRIEVHGKNLFYFFGEGPETAVMHIHFGMSGRFRVSPLPAPEFTPTTRLQLLNQDLGIAAHLSAMTVQHGDQDFYASQSGKIGPDPLREDANAELVWTKLRNTKKPVGLVLMDQSMVAGIGNIYRAEILFKSGVHPEQPGYTVERDAFDKIWRHSVLLLQRGFKAGSIITVDPEDAKKLGPPWTRRYVYNHPLCGKCHSKIEVWDMAARTVYACATCQPLVTGTQLSPARSQAYEGATPHKKFKSHCAPDPPNELPPAQLTVAELKAKLASLDQPSKGKKADLLERLLQALASQVKGEERTIPEPPANEAEVIAEQGAQTRSVEVKLDLKREPEAEAGKTQRKRARTSKKAFDTVLDEEDRNGAVVVNAAHTAGAAPLLRPGLPEKTHWDGLTLPMLRMELERRGLSAKGNKRTLVDRLNTCEADSRPQSFQDLQPGTQGITDIASAREAEQEKEEAGEGRNVEHVALAVDKPEEIEKRVKKHNFSVQATKSRKKSAKRKTKQ